MDVVCAECVEATDEGTSGVRVDEAIGVISADEESFEDESLPPGYHLIMFWSSSSSRMCFVNHNWSAMKQCLHPQSVAEICRHSVLSGDRILQCGTSSGSRHKNTTCL